MFRVGKFTYNRGERLPQITQQLFLANRQLYDTLTRGRASASPTAQLQSAAGKPPQKKSNTSDQQDKNSLHNQRWSRKIFSGIQPTGSLHLGNYLGAVRKWTHLQKARENVTLCIVDMHSITMPHNPPMLRENIFMMAATLLACGVDPAQSTLFVQSGVMEHAELNWILSSLTTMPRLAQLPQFKEKSRRVKDVPLGLYVYPVLQAADIMLYKATHVPVGADQLQHIQLAQHLIRAFNTRYGEMFPECSPMIEENDASRVLSLREPSKKMSKSDQDPRGTINLSDSPELIREKIKKAVTDFTSDITYSPSMRPGVSNLVNIHSHVTDESIATVVEEAKLLDTAKYKERVADAVIEHLRPIREKINMHLANERELCYVLEMGAEKARKVAQHTMSEVKQRLGLGISGPLPASVSVAPLLPDHAKLTASQRLAKGVLHPDANSHSLPHFEQRCEPGHGTLASLVGGNAGQSVTGGGGNFSPNQTLHRTVPVQTMRVEKSKNLMPSRHIFKMDQFNVPKMAFRDPGVVYAGKRPDQRERRTAVLGFSAAEYLATDNSSRLAGASYAGNANHSALAAVTSQVNAAVKDQERFSSLANSAFYKTAASSFNNTNPSVVNVAASTMQNHCNNSTSTSTTSTFSSSADSSETSKPKSSTIFVDEAENESEEREEDEENYAGDAPDSKIEKLN
ncbi:uncharacterized protein LOC6557638 [Drosophila grimshawi]|uniref:tryptophan--tRNA ligase n=1 Tax=Drosophila grimshawi TaxID=7222 RepID=B4J059_DROGR|nr:uncharacterized protein LOC6557638 [Drosophila grimshawi]EDV97852.1 GH17095 [Drosophila grimshawi]